MDLYAAIADPSRRTMLDILADGERPAGDLVREFPHLTQPAVSRHLRVLRDAGLVDVRPEGQQRIYVLRADNLRELDEWIATYRRFWPAKLRSLAAHLDRKKTQRDRKTERKE